MRTWEATEAGSHHSFWFTVTLAAEVINLCTTAAQLQQDSRTFKADVFLEVLVQKLILTPVTKAIRGFCGG